MKKKIFTRDPEGTLRPLFTGSLERVTEGGVWRWGSDNLFPRALSFLSRSSVIHRRILNDKSDYIVGQGFSCEGRGGGDGSDSLLGRFIESCNGRSESLRSVLGRVTLDKCTFGNGFMEVVLDKRGDFVSVYHQDASRCRLSKAGPYVLIHHRWSAYTPSQAKALPLYPYFELCDDGTYRSIVHYKDYEPTFTHYGVPKYIAALGSTRIAYKTDKWNVSRLENSFQPSGVMILDGQVDTTEDAEEIARVAEKKFAGKPGQVMFMVKNGLEGDGSKFVPLSGSGNDGDWSLLHDQATKDIVVAHSWFLTLSGLDYKTGFSSDRIQYEYQIALNTVIAVEQQELLEPLKSVLEDVLGVDCSSLVFVNKAPFVDFPKFMTVWEARKSSGLDYDPAEPSQQRLLAEIGGAQSGFGE